MTKKLHSFDDVLALWETPTLLSAALGTPYVTAQVMRHRRSISDDHWPRLIKQLAALGYDVTEGDLLAMKRARKAERQSERAAQVSAA